MREIKFRAWNDSPAVKAMLNWGHLRQVPFQELNGKHLHLMQFTGLHDKNGKEIYEGDVVQWNIESDNGWKNTKIDENQFIAWQETQARFCVTKGGEYDFWNPLGDFEPSEIKVIGNIYEIKRENEKHKTNAGNKYAE